MEFFNPNSNVDFMGARKWTALFSALIFVVSLGALFINGLKWGLDFTGGTQIEVTYPQQAADLAAIRDNLYKVGFKEAQVVSYGTSKDVLISIAPRADLDQSVLVEKVMAQLPGAVKQRVDFVGPQVGQELATKGALAIIVSLLATMIYIAMRFEYRLAVSSAVALIHDPILILGVFAMFGIEFDLKALAGLLAVIGYSLNDTIVVFDRVRENFFRNYEYFNQPNLVKNDYDLCFDPVCCCCIICLRRGNNPWFCFSTYHWYCHWYLFINLCSRCPRSCYGLG
jgi:preprotein translocase subunit SecF